MTATSDFAAHPLTFCKNNLLITDKELMQAEANRPVVEGLAKVVTGGRCYVGLDPYDRVAGGNTVIRGQRVDLSAIPVFRLVARPGPEDAIPAFWCPYKDGGLGTTVLGTQARFFFTITVNGCTVGLGTNLTAGASSSCTQMKWFGHAVRPPNTKSPREGKVIGNE